MLRYWSTRDPETFMWPTKRDKRRKWQGIQPHPRACLTDISSTRQQAGWCIRTAWQLLGEPSGPFAHPFTSLEPKSKCYKSKETPTWCNTVQVLFLQGHSICFGRKRPSSGVFKTSTTATGTCVIVAGKSSHLLIRADSCTCFQHYVLIIKRSKLSNASVHHSIVKWNTNLI